MTATEVRFLRVPEGRDLPPPSRGTSHAAGFDLRARVDEPLVLEPGARALVPTGVAIALPEGFEAQIRPRSGLALRHGVTMLNSPGTIDCDYRGEIAAIVINLGQARFRIERGDRIAQMVVQRLPAVELSEVDALPATARGAGGFGHTGV